MKLLIDTNVILDVVLSRAPWGDTAASLLAAIERGRATGYVAGHAITTVYYVTAKAQGRKRATTAVSDLLRLLTVVPLDAADFQRAMSLGLSDFEDAVQVAAALQVNVDYIVTRDVKHFAGTPLPARSAGEMLALVGATPVVLSDEETSKEV